MYPHPHTFRNWKTKICIWNAKFSQALDYYKIPFPTCHGSWRYPHANSSQEPGVLPFFFFASILRPPLLKFHPYTALIYPHIHPYTVLICRLCFPPWSFTSSSTEHCFLHPVPTTSHEVNAFSHSLNILPPFLNNYPHCLFWKTNKETKKPIYSKVLFSSV